MNSQASRDPSPRLVVRKALARVLPHALLVLGWVSYVLLCLPLLRSGGYNQGPFWDSMPLLWPAALIISRLLDPAVTTRRYKVAGYCLGCSLVAAALPEMTPSFFSLSQMMLAWLIFGPLFIMAGILIERLTSVGMRVLRIPAASPTRCAAQALGHHPLDAQTRAMASVEPKNQTSGSARSDGATKPGSQTVSRRRLAAAAVVLALAMATPFMSYVAAVLDLPAEARATADHVWLLRGMRRFHAFAGADRPWHTSALSGQIHFTEWLEPHTGTKFSMFPTPYWPWKIPDAAAYRAAFYAELARLMKIHGVPAWSLKNALFPRRQVIQLLHAKGFTAVRNFPYAINSYITIKDGRCIMGKQTPFPNDLRFPSTSGPTSISFKILRSHHGDIAVRSGRSRLAVYSSGGHILYEISPGKGNGGTRRGSGRPEK